MDKRSGPPEPVPLYEATDFRPTAQILFHRR
jgi:hypothetical protein